MVLAEGVNRIEHVSLHVRAPRRFGVVDLTPYLRDAVASCGLAGGTCRAFVKHTTCSLLINELESGLLEDIEALVSRLIPPAAYYAHDDENRRTENLTPGTIEPVNAPAHLGQMLVGAPSQTIPVVDGAVALGRWQSLLLIEFDEPRDREILFQLLGY